MKQRESHKCVRWSDDDAFRINRIIPTIHDTNMEI